MRRGLAVLCVGASVVVGIVAAAADTIAITDGQAGLYWDGSATSATISSADSQFVSEYFGAPTPRANADGSVDFSTAIPFTNGGNHALSQTYRGQTFSAWLDGSMTIRTEPLFLPPAEPEGAVRSFTTPFTMTGTITAYASADRSGTPLFSTNLTGGGTYTAGPYHVANGNWVRAHIGGDGMQFQSDVRTRALPSPWQTADVGDVGTPGYAYQGSDGDLFVGGAGSDIWGTADSFRFVHQSILDGEISAVIAGESNTHPFAKAGVMIRQTLDPRSPHVVLDVKPDGGVEFMTRSALGADTTFLAATSVPVQSNGTSVSIDATLRLVRSRGSVTASVCTGGGACQTIGVTPWQSGPALIGVAVTSHDSSVLNNVMVPANLPTVLTVPAPWASYDSGPVGQLRGDAFFQDDVFTVRGSGADIWGTSDAFHFVRQCLVDDSQLVARVVSEQNADPFGKAGLLMRGNDGATVILDVRPNGGIEFMARPTAGAPMGFLASEASAIPVWLKLERIGDQFTGYIADDGITWRQVGSTFASTTHGSCIEGGLAVTSHDAAAFNTSTFDHVLARSQVFADSDVGDVGIAGSASASAGGYVISGGGGDIWSSADAFNYLSRSLFGDGQIVARIDAVQDTDRFAKAGLMIRETLDPSAAHVILDVNPTGQIEFMTRPASGGATAFIAGSTMAFPGWLKLTRSGSLVSGFASADGQAWRLVGTTTLSIAPDALTGLAVTSHNRGVLNRSAFSSVGR